MQYGIAFWDHYHMDSIAYLPISEQQHYILCDKCSRWCDMRQLNEVLEHLHLNTKLMALWSGSRKRGGAHFYPNRDVCTNPLLHRQIDAAIIRKMNHRLKKIKHN